MRPLPIAAWSSVLLMLFMTPSGRANIGPKWWGDRAAEPLGLKDVAITHEELTIDLRPFAALQPVEVAAVYELNNSGSAKKLDLLFITGVSGVRDFEVRLGNRLLDSRRATEEGGSDRLPKSWQPPEYLPGLDSDQTQGRTHLAPSEKIVLAFMVELPPGRSTLRARYCSRATGTDEDYPTVTWQFPYILAPAREWGSFGGLNITVHIPERWQANSSPPLEREGGVLQGHFAELPADCLALAVRAPGGPELQQQIQRTIYWSLALYVLAMIGGSVLAWGVGRWLGGKRARWSLLWSSLAGMFLALLLFIGWTAVLLEIRYRMQTDILDILAGQESPYFHEKFFLPNLVTLGSIVLLLPLGITLATAGFQRSLRRAEQS